MARSLRSGRPWIALHTFAGVSGMSACRTPNGRSASSTELTIAGGDPTVADSPTPLAPIARLDGPGSARRVDRPVRQCFGQRHQYDNGLPIVSIDALGRITQYNYDSLGNPTKITYPDLTNDQYTYNSDSEPLTHTDGNGHTTSYTYDGNGNLTGIKDPLNNLTTMTYTSTGRSKRSTDANNHTTTYSI